MSGVRWSDKEVSLLKTLYPSYTKSEILKKFPNRTYASINLAASKFKIKKNLEAKQYKQSNIIKLLAEDPISYYWVGFLLADGYFFNNRVRLALSNLDKNHLIAFSDFIDCSNFKINKNHCCVSAKDTLLMPGLLKKFDIKKRKTYNPPRNFSIEKDELFVAFVIGFIDGDGSIKKVYKREDCSITIKLHCSWLDFLQKLSDRIAGLLQLKPNVAKINKSGYARVVFSNNKILVFLKKETIRLKLPVLDRKWAKIDETRKTRKEIYDIKYQRATELLLLGKRLEEVSVLAQISMGLLYKLLRVDRDLKARYNHARTNYSYGKDG